MAQLWESGRDTSELAAEATGTDLSLAIWLMLLPTDQVHFLPESHWSRIHPSSDLLTTMAHAGVLVDLLFCPVQFG